MRRTDYPRYVAMCLAIERTEVRKSNRVRSAIEAQVAAALGESMPDAWFIAMADDPEYGRFLAARHRATATRSGEV